MRRLAAFLAVWLSVAVAAALVAAELEVHFVDVGQGSAVVLRTEAAVVVVDAGPSQAAADYLSALGVTSVDLAIASHAHADHVGGFPAVFERFGVAQVWYNGQTHTTATFERFVDAVLASGARYREPRRGDRIAFGELLITVLHPAGSAADYTGHLHDMNIVVRAEYGRFSVLITGDAEEPAEAEMLAAGVRLRSSVLQLGHHGSASSSTAPFLRAVSPQVAVYQAGADGGYGHPHEEVLARVDAVTLARVFGTDVHGTIVIATDGESFGVRVERLPND